MILWSKLRRSRGFGIHSPFAFDLVLHTLRERDRYYTYTEIENIQHQAHAEGVGDLPSKSVLKLIVRLIARFQPRHIHLCGDPSGLIEKTIRLADSRIRFTSDAPTMVIIGRCKLTSTDIEIANATVARGGVAFLLDRRAMPEAAEAITRPMKRGMTFYSRHKLLVVGAGHLPRQNFEIAY